MPTFQPMPLKLRREPFDSGEWAFELKYGRFRALALVDRATVHLISRTGHRYRQFDQRRENRVTCTRRTAR